MRRLAKWLLVVLVLGELYARAGRELLFGDYFDQSDDLEHFRLWIELPVGLEVPVAPGALDVIVRRPDGGYVGRVYGARRKRGATDPAGYPAERVEVHGEFDRTMLGYPINVAVAQATDYTVVAVREWREGRSFAA